MDNVSCSLSSLILEIERSLNMYLIHIVLPINKYNPNDFLLTKFPSKLNRPGFYYFSWNIVQSKSDKTTYKNKNKNKNKSKQKTKDKIKTKKPKKKKKLIRNNYTKKRRNERTMNMIP